MDYWKYAYGNRDMKKQMKSHLHPNRHSTLRARCKDTGLHPLRSGTALDTTRLQVVDETQLHLHRSERS